MVYPGGLEVLWTMVGNLLCGYGIVACADADLTDRRGNGVGGKRRRSPSPLPQSRSERDVYIPSYGRERSPPSYRDAGGRRGGPPPASDYYGGGGGGGGYGGYGSYGSSGGYAYGGGYGEEACRC